MTRPPPPGVWPRYEHLIKLETGEAYPQAKNSVGPCKQPLVLELLNYDVRKGTAPERTSLRYLEEYLSGARPNASCSLQASALNATGAMRGDCIAAVRGVKSSPRALPVWQEESGSKRVRLFFVLVSRRPWRAWRGRRSLEP